MFHLPSGSEMIILLIIVLIIFGGGKLAGVGKSLGTAVSEFKDAVKGDSNDKKSETSSDGHNSAE